MYKASDPTLVRVLWIALAFGVSYLLWRMQVDKSRFEHFESSSDISENIIKIYYDNLHRAPTSEELKKQTKAIYEKNYDYNELELRLINSDEYQRLIKTQTNTILPETTRVLEEKDLVQRVKRVYMKVRGKTTPKEMYLPLKDLYIYFQYNVYKFVAMLRDTKYADFEDRVKSDEKMSRTSLIELYLSMFDDAKLNYDADAIEKMDQSLPKGSRFSDFLSAEGEPKPGDQGAVNAAALLAYLMRNAKDAEDRKKAAEEEERLRKLKAAAADLEKQRKLLTASAGKDSCTADQRIYLPNEYKILDTEYGFRVLQKFPPVCIPVGKKNEVSDPIIYSKLEGTPLSEAQDSQVGSIMPKFEYRPYIEIPVPGTTTPPPAPPKKV